MEDLVDEETFYSEMELRSMYLSDWIQYDNGKNMESFFYRALHPAEHWPVGYAVRSLSANELTGY